jgi:uncharacterized ferredoxin-like protein
MTTDELLTKINPMTNDDAIFMKDALRSVVQLHTHVLTGKKSRGKAGLSKRCTECGFAYPCPTIEAIEKELG